jgi:TonB family protein
VIRRQVQPTVVVDDEAPLRVGAIDIEIVVDSRGRVAYTRLISGIGDRIDAAAVEALRSWEFNPARNARGEPVAVMVGIRFAVAPPPQDGAATGPAVTSMLGLLPLEPLPAAAVVDAVPSVGTPGIQVPTLLVAVRPTYTTEGMRRKIQGEVEMELVVLPDGTVGAARVVKSLDADSGLDHEALIAARYWRFEPARLNRRPVPATVTLTLSFKLH